MMRLSKTGCLIDAGAPPREWVKILTRVINDKKHREEMGRNLHAVTEEYFDLNKVAGFRLELYREAMRAKNHSLKSGLADAFNNKND